MEFFDLSTQTVDKIEFAVYLPQTVSGVLPPPGTKIRDFGPRRYHGLIVNESSTVVYTVEEKKLFSLEPGSVLYLPKGRPYIVRSGIPGSCYCVNFQLVQNVCPEPFMQKSRNPARWLQLFHTMTHLWNCGQPGFQARCLSILYEMLAMLTEDHQASYLGGPAVEAIRRAMQQAEENGSLSGEALSIAHLAETCAISETYFRRLFHQIYGLSPKQYLLNARFRRACVLLETSDDAISSVASVCGFESVYHFSRAFRQEFGVSPSAYRISRRA